MNRKTIGLAVVPIAAACGLSMWNAARSEDAPPDLPFRVFAPGLAADVSLALPRGTVSGRVLWNEQPVQGASVYATDEYDFGSAHYGSALTDNEGRFTLPGIPDGEQYLYVFGPTGDFWASVVTAVVLGPEVGTVAQDTHMCRGFHPLSPAEGAATNSTPMLTWPPYPDAVDYAVRVLAEGADSFIFQRGDFDPRLEATSVVVDTPLSPGAYSWRVDAFNALGHIIGCSYSPRSFTVN